MPHVRPLFARYPGTAGLPHVHLVEAPTPVVRIDGDLAEQVGGLWVKRDDVTAQAYGGNKVRKLEFTLGRALAEGRRSVLTFGALGSNHVLATAVHGAPLGLDVHAILTPQARTPYLAANLAADRAAGATLHPVPRFQDAARKAVEVRRELSARDGIEPWVIPFGGTSPDAEAGFVNAAFELAEQVEAGEMPEPDLVYVPLGSTGTAVGLALGFAVAGMRTRVIGVRVVPVDAVALEQLAEVATDAIALLRQADASFPGLRPDALPIDVREGYLGEGYAVPTEGGRNALDRAATAGFRLEGTYTAKTLAALFDDALAGVLADKTVLFWNTYNSRSLSVSAEGAPEELAAFVLD